MTEAKAQSSPSPEPGRAEVADTTDRIEHAEAMTELKLQEVAFRGALGTTDNVLQPTLKDFLR